MGRAGAAVWEQLTKRRKIGGDLYKSHPLWSLLTFSFGMGISVQSLRNLLLPSMPEAVGELILKLALPCVSSF